MADQITEVATRRGHDVRDFTLVAGGGAGPVHAASIADLLHIPRVVIPPIAATYSAFGMFAMDVGRNYGRSYIARANQLDLDRINALYAEMEGEAATAFAGMGITPDAIELLTFRLRATTPKAPFELSRIAPGTGDPSGALKRRRTVWWDGSAVDTPVYDGAALRAGDRFDGPAVIEETTTTVVIPPRYRAEVDPFKNYVLTRDGVEAGTRDGRLAAAIGGSAE
jgi:N-methylhydantoinase A